MAAKTMKRCILVPVDFSAHSEAALIFAAHLAERLGGNLVVLHVVHDPGENPGYYLKRKKKQLHKIEDLAREMMAEFLHKMRDEQPQHKAIAKAESMLVVGLPVSRILEIVNKLRPELVVMGSQGRTGLAHLALGSKAEQVTRLCPVPVTIVKASAS